MFPMKAGWNTLPQWRHQARSAYKLWPLAIDDSPCLSRDCLRTQRRQFGAGVVGGESGASLSEERATVFRRCRMAERSFTPRGLCARDFQWEAEAGGAFQRLGKQRVRCGPIAALGEEAGAQALTLSEQKRAAMRPRRRQGCIEVRPGFGDSPLRQQRLGQPEQDARLQVPVSLAGDER